MRFEDNLPVIYQQVLGTGFPGPPLEEQRIFGTEEVRLLRELCGDDHMHFELTRNLLDIEWRYQTMARRRGLFDELEGALATQLLLG